MTTYNKATLKTFFANGDVPSGQDFANFIDSYVNIVDTVDQSMAGALITTQLVTPQVSATNINVTGVLSAATIATNSFSLTNLTATNANVANIVSAAGLNVTGDVSAATGTVYASAIRMGGGGIYRTVTVVSAAGTTQATGASLGNNGVIRLKGIVDGSTTGFLLVANATGLQQTIYVEENTSCNLWPCAGGQINALSSNAAYGLAGNTQYIITHIKASGYSVK